VDTALVRVHVRGFRTIEDATFRPARVTALVGEASAGKSNLLAAVRALLDPEGAPLTAPDLARGDGPIRISAELADGSELSLEATPSELSSVDARERPAVVFLPASLRAGRLVARSRRSPAPVRHATRILRTSVDDARSEPPSATEAARGLVRAVERWVDEEIRDVILLLEEPELFLPPQTQRYLYRLLRRLADRANQVLYSTHSPAFLNVARLEELVIAIREDAGGTRLLEPEPLPQDEEFRASSEFDATRGEVFLARAAVLVEGMTEKLALPFVFEAMGHDPDRERISIVECGGKPNIVVIARVCAAVGIPFVAVHDRDAPPGSRPSEAESKLNALLGEVAGRNRVELAPDFEGVAGLRSHHHKPAQAFRSFGAAGGRAIPEPLARIVRLAVELAER
jgi:predicted ATP-dependent endonuclease of OLD family